MGATYELKYPIKAHGNEVTELSFRRLTVRDLMKMDAVQGEIAKIAKIIEASADIPASSVAMIDAEDLAGISEVISGFLPSSLATGSSAASD